MYEAYREGKDLYAMIAQSAFNNNYEDNLEFWSEGTELDIDGHKVIAGYKTHLNKEGKARRAVGKVLNLSATYGMGGATAGARLNKTAEEGEALLNSFFTEFKGVKKAIDDSKEFLKKNGYVEDFVGRRRRLSDINLDPYQAKVKNKVDNDINFNPFINCIDRKDANDPEVTWVQILDQYILLSNASRAASVIIERRKPTEERVAAKCTFEYKNEVSNQTYDKLSKIAAKPSYAGQQPWSGSKKTSVQKIAEDANIVRNLLVNGEYLFYDFKTKQKANLNLASELPEFKEAIKKYKDKYGTTVQSNIPKESVILSAWTGKIAQAARQCFNGRIQGSSSSLTKMAMVDIFNDRQLKEWGANLIITVHDEVLVECPAYYADKVEKRLPEIMINAAKEGGDDVPQACDPYNVTRWYSDTAAATVMEEFKKLEQNGLNREEALEKVISNHIEIPKEALIKTIETGCDLDF